MTNSIIYSMVTNEEIVTLFRDFHNIFGHSENGPSLDLDLGKISRMSITFSQLELDILRGALADLTLRQQFTECQQIIEDLATV
jgi:hypothetical protein